VKKSMSLQHKFVGLPLIGRIDCETQFNVEVGAFQKAFVRSIRLTAFKKAISETLERVTHVCHDNSQVL